MTDIVPCFKCMNGWANEIAKNKYQCMECDEIFSGRTHTVGDGEIGAEIEKVRMFLKKD